jgi:hypothetical protein
MNKTRKIMKTMNKSILILVAMIIGVSCAKEGMMKVDPGFVLSFQRDGMTNAYAGTPFYVIPTGSGEFLTLFDGTPGRVWGETGAKGLDFNKADSVAINYSLAGTYQLSMVATSAGDYGKDLVRQAKTVEVKVVDDRNTFSGFSINGVAGEFTPDGEIKFSVPDVVTDFHFIAEFGFKSDLAKAFVNGVEQVSGVTVNDFSIPVVYTVRAATGAERNYTVKFSTFPASSEKKILKFSLGVGGNDEVGGIDEENKVITLVANYATNLAAVRIKLESSYASKVYFGTTIYSDRKNYNLTSSGIRKVKVVAQNNSEVEYNLNTSTDNPVKKFTFAGLVPAPAGIIDIAAKTITVDVLKGTEITKLIALWEGSVGKVTIGTTTQVNGVTVNDFTSPKQYTFYKGTTPGDKYTVTVKEK